MDWTGNQVSDLTRYWAGGLSAAQIATEMGITRSAVLGKVNRLDLPMRARGRKGTAAAKPNRQRRRKRLPVVIAAGVVIPPEQRRTLMQLRPGVCRWPVGHPGEADFFFCGGECDRTMPYCEAHREIAYWRRPSNPPFVPHGLAQSQGEARFMEMSLDHSSMRQWWSSR